MYPVPLWSAAALLQPLNRSKGLSNFGNEKPTNRNQHSSYSILAARLTFKFIPLTSLKED